MFRIRISGTVMGPVVAGILASAALSLPCRAAPDNIPQPKLGSLKHLPVAPMNKRVDIKVPKFSKPTEITHPLFPVTAVSQAILMGHEDGTPLQVVYTLLPKSHNRVINWNGRKIETRTVQYVAHLDRRITEYALDWYAQADDGSVWYFGEDVFNYKDGVVEDTDGTWLAGREGVAAMIMPANPHIDDAYRVENIPGKAFEEIRVKAVNVTVDGPLGPVKGCMIGEQLHMDGTYSDKTFCPGYGEFFTAKDLELEAVGLAAPTDTTPAPHAVELERIRQGALQLLSAADASDWKAAEDTFKTMEAAWGNYRGKGAVSKPLAAQMDRALRGVSGDAIEPGLAQKHKTGVAIGALEVAFAALDLELRHRSVLEIDRDRFHVWLRKTAIDVKAQVQGAVLSDVRTLELLRDRLAHMLDPAKARRVDTLLKALRSAAETERFSPASEATKQLLNEGLR